MQIEKRLSLDEAQKEILNMLPLDHPMSINEFKNTQMQSGSWQTIHKAISLIIEIQKHFLEENIVLDVKKERNRYILSTRLGNILSLPVEERVRYVRQKYFPQPMQEDVLLVELFRRNAITKEKAIQLKEDKITEKLLNQEKIDKINQKIFLTEEGMMVAKGLIKLYPELK